MEPAFVLSLTAGVRDQPSPSVADVEFSSCHLGVGSQRARRLVWCLCVLPPAGGWLEIAVALGLAAGHSHENPSRKYNSQIPFCCFQKNFPPALL